MVSVQTPVDLKLLLGMGESVLPIENIFFSYWTVSCTTGHRKYAITALKMTCDRAERYSFFFPSVKIC